MHEEMHPLVYVSVTSFNIPAPGTSVFSFGSSFILTECYMSQRSQNITTMSVHNPDDVPMCHKTMLFSVSN